MLVTMVTVLASVPVYAASASWSIDMSFYFLDGQANGQFHNLADTSRGITVSGTLKSAERLPGSTPSPREISVNISDDDGAFGDDFIGNFKVKPAANEGASMTFSEEFPSASSVDDEDNIGEYYMVWNKGLHDYWRITGSGTVTN